MIFAVQDLRCSCCSCSRSVGEIHGPSYTTLLQRRHCVRYAPFLIGFYNSHCLGPDPM